MSLIYHQAFDSYHCIYRALQILRRTRRTFLEVDRLRIWDFFLVFPAETRKISFPSNLSLFKRSDILPNSYEDVIDPKLIFERMKSFQLTAYRSLVAFGLIDSAEFLKHRIVRGEREIPARLSARLEKISEYEEYVLSLVSSPLDELPLYGEKGLKDRTKLLDYRYDLT
jgi:hypothetical protein